jgi:hypothetical protein
MHPRNSTDCAGDENSVFVGHYTQAPLLIRNDLIAQSVNPPKKLEGLKNLPILSSSIGI